MPKSNNYLSVIVDSITLPIDIQAVLCRQIRHWDDQATVGPGQLYIIFSYLVLVLHGLTIHGIYHDHSSIQVVLHRQQWARCTRHEQ